VILIVFLKRENIRSCLGGRKADKAAAEQGTKRLMMGCPKTTETLDFVGDDELHQGQKSGKAHGTSSLFFVNLLLYRIQ